MLARRLLVAAFSIVLVAGCGRSSTMGGSPFDCPANQLRPDGTCGLLDGGHNDGFGDSGHVDGGGDGGGCTAQLATQCQQTACADPRCCDCGSCAFTPICQHRDGGSDGDAGDFCGDPNHCKDPQCVGDPRCHVLGDEICNNGIDDNDNGLTDCKDPQCFNFQGCKMHMCAVPVDCTDPLCNQVPECQDLKCHPTVDFGTLNPTNSSSTKMVNTTGTTDSAITPCAPGHAGMVVGKFDLTGPAAVTLTFTQGQGEDHVFSIYNAGINQGCGDNPVPNACYDPKSATSGSHTYDLTNAGEYYIIIQPFEPAGQGPVTVTLATEMTKEICNNGVDDNNNGLIDCADPDCFNDPNCKTQECVPDFNVGALVVNGPGQTVSFDTGSADVENNLPTCQATTGGDDVVVRFTLKETAGILLQWDQTGDHVVGLGVTPDGGHPCDFNLVGCYDPSGRQQDQVAWGDFPPGDYVFIFKATRPGAEGHIDATISAYRNRRVELCHNGIDDDGNGLTDCADPACVGVSGCSAPYCMPDVQLGAMNVNDSQSVTLNVQQNGILGYHASCAKGGGKGMVVQLSVPNGGSMGGFGIGFDCTQTGDHVLDLYAAGGPRDTCDAQTNSEVCADPKTLPFGCGYEIPNLQPGTFNVIVEGFTAGSEGVVNLTLSVIDDRQLEICNNGIDDDMNGFTDCQDKKCATSPFCAKSQCKPDATVDPVPLTGAQVFRLVTTQNNGTHGAVPCATAPGGQAAVVEFQVTAPADLTVQYTQIGNHAVALYTDVGAMLACDAGTLLGCAPAVGFNMSGMQSFSNVPPGSYYLILAGDQPDGTTQYSGAVNLAISGMPH
ncbi:MAG TPA: hypothetical protein VFF06_27335 [Polyangia bacterium]|nr:hypothetical protein [Polyangia bacterium]